MKRLSERKQSKKENNTPKRRINIKKLALLSGGIVVVVTVFATYISGYSSRVVNLQPIMKIGEKSTTLNCEYGGNKVSLDVTTYSNINNYYKNLAIKNSGIEQGRYQEFIYSNPNDKTMKEVASKVKSLATTKGLNEDQTIELVTCFVQNIPYDEEKAGIVLGDVNISNYDLSQTPYETIHNNSGICTDKTYLASMLIKELGYSTAIMVFPDAEHMALGILAPNGYGDFNTKYAYMEVTTPGFAPGEVPEDVSNANGKPAVSIRKFDDLTKDIDPSKLDLYSGKTISLPNAVIDVNNGKTYERIKQVVDLENKILAGIDNLVARKNTLESAYSEMIRRDNYQESMYRTYSSISSTTYECGYEYNYSYNYYSYNYGYSSPYSYECEYVTNPRKSSAYRSYEYALDSYNAQVYHYNGLIDGYNEALSAVKQNINKYKAYEYN